LLSVFSKFFEIPTPLKEGGRREKVEAPAEGSARAS
jgi:hypothetical protein